MLQVLLVPWLMQEYAAGVLLFLHETLLLPVVMFGSEKIIWKEKGRCSIRVVQMDNLRGLLGNRRKDKVLNAHLKDLYGVRNG